MSIPLIVLDFTEHVYELAKIDAAVDGEHLGPKIHKEIAEFYKNRLQTLWATLTHYLKETKIVSTL